MTDVSNRPRTWWENGSVSASLLTVVVLAGSLASDKWVPNSQLTLPLLISTSVAALVAAAGIPRLKALKMGQVIRVEGPQAHQFKAGTPTMGGLLVVPVGTIVGGLISLEGSSAQQLLAVSAITLGYMVIGGFDDWRSLTRQTNTGLTPRGKLLLQGLMGVLFLAVAAWQGWISSSVSLPFGWSLPLGWLIWPLGLFVFLP